MLRRAIDKGVGKEEAVKQAERQEGPAASANTTQGPQQGGDSCDGQKKGCGGSFRLIWQVDPASVPVVGFFGRMLA